ncbi:MAG TPA: DUF3301 domain-containing protein [Gammaproteobacteria bacterium]|jgi:hypothetical protein|nr:DUF3301 domain-containing protein [Gammaproteobacteria bacterium]
MYIDTSTWVAFALLTLVCVAIWFWNDSLLARERMLETCARLCRDLRLQFLDETVTLASIRPGRSEAGWLEFTRLYLFEFSGTGQDRWQGRATLAGRRVVSVQFDNPEGVTILGAGAPLSPEVAKLTHAAPSGDEPTLH